MLPWLRRAHRGGGPALHEQMAPEPGELVRAQTFTVRPGRVATNISGFLTPQLASGHDAGFFSRSLY
jgi:hypothetical protein